MKGETLARTQEDAARGKECPPAIPAGTFVVVPAYNEATCIERVLRDLVQVCPNVVVVDDGSRDGTYAAARRAAPYVLQHALNRGQGAALQTGIEFALRRGARYVVTFDADGQHCIENIAALLAPISSGKYDITLGSRFLGEAVRIPPLRKAALRLAVLFTRLVSRIPVTDTHNGLRAFSRRAAEQINITNDRMAHASEIIDIIRQLNLPYCEVPVRVEYTEYSLKKVRSLRGAVRILFDYFVTRAAT